MSGFGRTRDATRDDRSASTPAAATPNEEPFRSEPRAAPDVSGDDTVAKLSLVGVGMRSHAGVATRLFEALAREGIGVRLVSTS